MMSVTARKGKGLDDTINGLIPAPLEESHAVRRTGISTYDRLLQKYEQLLSLHRFTPFEAQEKDLDACIDAITEILTPLQINSFYQGLVRYEHRGRNHVDGVGLFLSILIQNSYDAGNNDFMMETELSKKPNYLGTSIRGTAERPLILTVHGDVGDGFCSGGEYVHATVPGWGLAFFTDKSQHCRFTIDEYVFLEDWSVYDNCYRTTDLRTIEILKNNVPKGRNNKIIFIHPEGWEETVRDMQ